jgi:hypothetical protein
MTPAQEGVLKEVPGTGRQNIGKTKRENCDAGGANSGNAGSMMEH